MLKKFLQDDSGATAIEYGLIAALISISLIGAASLIGKNLDGKFTEVSSGLSEADEFLGEN